MPSNFSLKTYHIYDFSLIVIKKLINVYQFFFYNIMVFLSMNDYDFIEPYYKSKLKQCRT